MAISPMVRLPLLKSSKKTWPYLPSPTAPLPHSGQSGVTIGHRPAECACELEVVLPDLVGVALGDMEARLGFSSLDPQQDYAYLPRDEIRYDGQTWKVWCVCVWEGGGRGGTEEEDRRWRGRWSLPKPQTCPAQPLVSPADIWACPSSSSRIISVPGTLGIFEASIKSRTISITMVVNLSAAALDTSYASIASFSLKSSSSVPI